MSRLPETLKSSNALKLLKMFASSAIALMHLCRFHTLIGAQLLWWPCMWGIALAFDPKFHKTWIIPPYILWLSQNIFPATMTDQLLENQTLYLFFTAILVFGFGALVMRTAGCILNDIIDRHLDAQVIRTKGRPLACGRLSLHTAFASLAVFLSMGLCIALLLPFEAKILCGVAFVFLLVYPLMKYIMPIPQLILGLAFNSGVLICFTTFHPQFLYDLLLFFSDGRHLYEGYCLYEGYWDVLVLYLAGIFWTLAYDTVYAFQDIKDDMRCNIYSSAIVFRHHPALTICVFNILMMTCVYWVAMKEDYTKSSLLLYIIVCAIHAWNIYANVYLDTDIKKSWKYFKKQCIIGILVFFLML